MHRVRRNSKSSSKYGDRCLDSAERLEDWSMVMESHRRFARVVFRTNVDNGLKRRHGYPI